MGLLDSGSIGYAERTEIRCSRDVASFDRSGNRKKAELFGDIEGWHKNEEGPRGQTATFNKGGRAESGEAVED